MGKEAEQKMNELCNTPNNVFKLVKFLNEEGQDINSGRCFQGINSKFVLSKKN